MNKADLIENIGKCQYLLDEMSIKQTHVDDMLSFFKTTFDEFGLFFNSSLAWMHADEQAKNKLPLPFPALKIDVNRRAESQKEGEQAVEKFGKYILEATGIINDSNAVRDEYEVFNKEVTVFYNAFSKSVNKMMAAGADVDAMGRMSNKYLMNIKEWDEKTTVILRRVRRLDERVKDIRSRINALRGIN